jgi:hypothetical protein
MNNSHPAQKEIRRILVNRAKKTELITYKELTKLIRTIKLVPNSKILSDLLTSISYDEKAAGRGLLSAIVIRKTRTGNGMPGKGFFRKFAAGVQRKNFRRHWEKEHDKVFKVWRGRS